MVMPLVASNRRWLDTMVLMVILEGLTPNTVDDAVTKAVE